MILADFTEARTVLDRFMADPANLARIEQAARLMSESLSTGGKILSGGNGGSLCDAGYFAEEPTGRYRQDRPALVHVEIRVSHEGYADRIQKVHIKVIHILLHFIEHLLVAPAIENKR